MAFSASRRHGVRGDVMASNVPAKIKFLTDEIDGLKARIGSNPNATQREKLAMLTDIQRDYQSALERRNAGTA